MTYGHLQADCLYTGSAPGPTLGVEYGKAFTFTFTEHSTNTLIQPSVRCGKGWAVQKRLNRVGYTNPVVQATHVSDGSAH